MKLLKRSYFYYKHLPLSKLPFFILSKFLNIRIRGHDKYLTLFQGKNGLEIGGPSNYFCSNNILPIYSVIKNLDGVNFSNNTIWEGVLSEGMKFEYEQATRIGRQYICDAVDLKSIPSKKYDFIVACNSLEHIANPILAIKEWLRVIKQNGLLFMVLPNKMLNFDHKRKVVTFNHLISDYDSKINEDDLSHFDEILNLHDLSLDPQAGTLDSFEKRAMKNYENRALHHHVFDMRLLKEIYSHLNVQVLLENTTTSDYFIVGRKT